MLKRPASRASVGRCRKQLGMSIVELLVGVAVGLLIIGGATKLFVDYLVSTRRSLVETRVNQDLRAAADLIARDFRRAAYWQGAASGVVDPPSLNVYRAVSVTGAASSASVTYTFSRDAGAENNTVDANESFGFQLNTATNAIEARIGTSTWQQLTDPNSVRVTEFSVTPLLRTVEAGQYCTPRCCLPNAGNPAICADTTLAGATPNASCPVVRVRRYDIVLVGQAPNDAAVRREIRESVRLRNDEIPVAGCP
jgi:prepilin peptidase dependent protein B